MSVLLFHCWHLIMMFVFCHFVCVDSLANDTFVSMQLIYVQSRLTHITSSYNSIPIIMAQRGGAHAGRVSVSYSESMHLGAYLWIINTDAEEIITCAGW